MTFSLRWRNAWLLSTGWLVLCCSNTVRAEPRALVFDFNSKNLSDATQTQLATSEAVLVSIPELKPLGKYVFGEGVAGAFFNDGGFMVTGRPVGGTRQGEDPMQKALFFSGGTDQPGKPREILLNKGIAAFRFFSPHPEIFLSSNGREVSLVMRGISNYYTLVILDEQGKTISEISLEGPLERCTDFVLGRNGVILSKLFKAPSSETEMVTSTLLLIDAKDGHVLDQTNLPNESEHLVEASPGGDRAFLLLETGNKGSDTKSYQLATVSAVAKKLEVRTIATDLKTEGLDHIAFTRATVAGTLLVGVGRGDNIRTLNSIDCETGKTMRSHDFTRVQTSFSLSTDGHFLVTTDSDSADVRVFDAQDFHEVNASKRIVVHPLYVICQ